MGHPTEIKIKVKGSGQECPLHMRREGDVRFSITQLPNYTITQSLDGFPAEEVDQLDDQDDYHH